MATQQKQGDEDVTLTEAAWMKIERLKHVHSCTRGQAVTRYIDDCRRLAKIPGGHLINARYLARIAR
jgi:hypothetical protein